MLMKQKIYILLDRSGSMASMWKEAVTGINAYVEKLYENNADVMMAVFDSGGYDVLRNTTTRDWKPLTTGEVEPRGGTPLLDSAARMMWNMMDSKADRAILVVVTDGYENSSTHFKATEVKEMTKQLTSKYGYDIVFLGANFDGINDVAAQSFGVNDTGKFMASTAGAFRGSMETTAAGTKEYFTSGRGVSYTAEDKAKAKQ